MHSKTPRSAYLTTTSPNPSYYGYSSDNTFDTINDTIPSPVRSIIHIGRYSLSPNQTLSSKSTNQTSLSPKIQTRKPMSPLTTRKPPPIQRRIKSVIITRRNTITTNNSYQSKYNNNNNKIPFILKTNNSTEYFNNNNNNKQMPYIENEDDVSSSYYDNNEGSNTIRNELVLSTPGDSAKSLSSDFNNSDVLYSSEYENESLIHGTIDEMDEKNEITNSNYNIENNNDIIAQQNEIINDLKIQLKKANNKINILNNKVDDYENEIYELINNVNMYSDKSVVYKKQIKQLQKQLTNLQCKQYNQFAELTIGTRSRNNSKKRKSDSKKRRRSRTWISKHELNIKEMDNIKEYELNGGNNERNNSLIDDWSCALSVLNSDNSIQYNLNENDLFYD